MKDLNWSQVDIIKTDIEGMAIEFGRELIEKQIKFKCIDFSSVYYLGTRVLNEVVIDKEKYPPYTSPLNPVFYDLERKYSGGGIGLQQLYVIEI